MSFRELLLGEDPVAIDRQIAWILGEMDGEDPCSEKYQTNLRNLERLYELKRGGKPRKHISPDTVLQVAGSLGAVLIIVAYEQKHVIATKALNFFPRGN